MNAPKQVNRLSAREMYQLTEFVREHYVKSALYDTDFATKATTDLGFTVSDSSVRTARETLGLPSNRDVERATRASPDTSALSAQIAKLESAVQAQAERLAKLETQMHIIVAYAQKAGKTSDLSGLAFSLKDG